MKENKIVKNIIKPLNDIYILKLINLFNPKKKGLSLISGKIAYIRKQKEYFIGNYSKGNYCDEIDDEIFKSINERYPGAKMTTEILTFNSNLLVLEQLHISEINPIECIVQLSIKPDITFKIFIFLPIDRSYLKERHFIFNCSQEYFDLVLEKLENVDFLENDERILLQKYLQK